MHYLNAELGCSIQRFAEDLVKVAEVVEVVGVFNDTWLNIKKGDTKEDIINQFWNKRG